MPNWREHAKNDLKGYNTIVTGSSSGIGVETVRELAILGAKVVLACRSEEKTKLVIDKLLEESNDLIKSEQLIFLKLDLQSLESIREFSEKVKSVFPTIQLLINNAGVMMIPKRQLTKDGFEFQLGVNHIGHFYLTYLLKDVLFASGEDVRIVNVSSMAHAENGHIHFEDLHLEKSYGQWKSYAQSKLANVLFTLEFAKRYPDSNVKIYSIHPGGVRTSLDRYSFNAKVMTFFSRPMLISPSEGAYTTLYCALTKEPITNGAYYDKCKEKQASAEGRNPEVAQRLWSETCKLLDIEW